MWRAVVWGLVVWSTHGRCASQHNTSVDNSPIKQPQLSFVAFLTTSDGGVVCAGAVLHPYYVLTAAGCFRTEAGDMIAYQHKLLVDNVYKTIRQLIPHPAYRLQTTYYDVGLIKVAERIRLGARVTAIKMAYSQQTEIGDVLKTACWKMDNKRSWLEEESTNIITRSLCSDAPVLGLFITTNLVCARVDNQCDVSNGSPLYADGRQYGVATRHIHGRTVYIMVDDVRDWIFKVLYG